MRYFGGKDSARPKHVLIFMPDDSVWSVPISTLAEKWAEFYTAIDVENEPTANKYERFRVHFHQALEDEQALLTFSQRVVEWNEISRDARRVGLDRIPLYKDGWKQGPMEVYRPLLHK